MELAPPAFQSPASAPYWQNLTDPDGKAQMFVEPQPSITELSAEWPVVEFRDNSFINIASLYGR